MKYTLISTALLMSIGIAQAGSNWEMQKEKAAADSATKTMQNTAVQPGIGERSGQFEDAAQYEDYNHGDWTDLRNTEIYGSF